MEAEADERQEAVINYYAKARVGVRKIASAIGFFALLWSTVVLLGGFVSVLLPKDFWFLSAMSLAMASKMLDFFGTDDGGIYVAEWSILRSSKGLDDQVEEDDRHEYWTHIFTLYAVNAVKTISIFIMGFILGVSPYVNIGLSVARLVQRDYGDAGGDAANKAKLNAALTAFYILVISHSSYIIYWIVLDICEPWMLVSKHSGLGIWGPKIVRKYRTETNDKCRNDGLLPSNWNLITFSVGLLESASQEDRLWGARVLDTFNSKGIPTRHELQSSSKAIQNLIDMTGLSMTDDPEIRERAARILADLASELRIAQFPDLLRCLFCLIESCNQYRNPQVAHHPSENCDQTLHNTAGKVSGETFHHGHHQEDSHLSLAIKDDKQLVNLLSSQRPGLPSLRKIKNLLSSNLPKRRSPTSLLRILIGKKFRERLEWNTYLKNYKYSYLSKGTIELVSQGQVILERLTQDEDNCIEITKHQRLLSKIILPLNYQDFLSDHTWFEILGRSLTVVSRLISAGPADVTTRLRQDMSRNAVAIRNLMHILEVDSEASRKLYEQAIEILTELAFNDPFRKLAFDESTSMTEMFAKTLRHIFLEERDGDAIVAKEEREKDKRVRRKAGEALATLLRLPSATDNDDASTSATNVNVVDLLPKQDMIDLLTKAVNQILSSKGEKAANVVTLPGSINGFRVEMVVESQSPNGADTRQSSPTQETEEQPEDGKMLAAMLSLTVAICNNKTVISEDDCTGAIPDDAALVKKLKEIAETNMDATADGWRIQKLVCQVVMAVVQLKPSYIRELNEHNFKEALSKALETMSDIDNCMIFGGDDREVPARSLASLVKEAQKLLAQDQGDIIST